MFKRITHGVVAAAFLLSPGGVWAQPDQQVATLSTPGVERTLVLPPAAENAPVISLGTAVDPVTGNTVEGLAIIHYKKQYSHKPQHGGGGSGGATCYSFLASGAKWKAIEPWVMNTTNGAGLDGGTSFSTEAAAIEEWEDAADGALGNGGVNILGDGAVTSDLLSADTSAPDGLNEVYFGSVSTPGAIAVTIVWGIFSGPPSGRSLVEWDQVYDDADFSWSQTGEAGKMDFENIAQHEIGHSIGMNHPSDGCTDETMFRFADVGETKKRDLNAGDIAGANKLY